MGKKVKSNEQYERELVKKYRRHLVVSAQGSGGEAEYVDMACGEHNWVMFSARAKEVTCLRCLRARGKRGKSCLG